jgi:phosphoglycerol transferase
MSGGGVRLLPDLDVPYGYKGDGLFTLWGAQRLIEGWLFDNPRSGYPFGSNFLDYPGSDFGNNFFIKFLGWIGASSEAALNLYFLLGFSFNFIFAYLGLRFFGISIALSMAGAFVFDYLPFHFLRLGHLYYTWYFVVPIFFWLGLTCFESAKLWTVRRLTPRKIFFFVLGLIFLASFGVYYALFGVIILSISGVFGSIAYKSKWPVLCAAFFAGVISFGVFLNISPNIAHRATHGANPEVAKRSPVESEIYGLRLTQLLLPQPKHRSKRLSAIANSYNQTHPLVNENATSALGIIGSFGLFALFVVLVFRMAGRKVDVRLSMLALLVLVLFMFGTIGGFGSLFANLVSPSMRGWNRISVFIGFGAIAGLLLMMQLMVEQYLSPEKRKWALPLLAILLMLLAIYDQTMPACIACREQVKKEFDHDHAFIQAIEKQLPPGAAVYQLPYFPFPETPPLHNLQDYDLTVGFVHSQNLRWSYGGMKGRPGDLFFRGLAQEPIEQQINVIKRLGFSGIYIDRRGYVDNGVALIAQFSSLMGHGPSIEHVDGRMVFFAIDGAGPVLPDGLDASWIMKEASYYADHLGRRYPSTLKEGIDFSREGMPVFLREAVGLSGQEPWGRWSDAGVASKVRFDFKDPLPKRFILFIDMITFGPNAGRDMAIKVGEQNFNVKLPINSGLVRKSIETQSEAGFVELYPPKPTSPADIGMSADQRKLGIGLVSLRIEPLNDQ